MTITEITDGEQRRLDGLAALTPEELGEELTALVGTATALAADALDSELETMSQCSRTDTVQRQLYEAALHALAEALFVRFVGTDLCPAEPPDINGARRLVAEARGR